MKLRLFIVALHIVACSSNESIKIIKKSNSNITINLDSVSVSIDQYSHNYYQLFDTYESRDEIFYFGYNKGIHSINVFNLSDQTELASLNLDFNGPNWVHSIDGIDVHNLDSIFVLSYGYLSLLDSEANVINRWSIHSDDVFTNIPLGEFFAEANFNIYYAEKEKSVYMYYRPVSLGYLSDEYINQPFLAAYDLISSTLKIIPIHYSDYYKRHNGKFGDLVHPNVTYFDEGIIYSFKMEPNIYVYNNSESKTIQHQSKLKNAHNEFADPINSTNSIELEKHFLSSTIYFKTIYDKYRNMFYRIHWQGISANNKIDNPYAVRNVFLSVYDDNMNIIIEKKLKRNTYIVDSWFVAKEGLYLNIAHPNNSNQDSDKMVYHILEFRKEL